MAKRKHLPRGFVSTPWKRGVKKVKKTIPVMEKKSIEVVELTEGAAASALKTTGDFLKFGIRGISDLGKVGMDVLGSAGGVVTTGIEIPIDLGYRTLNEAERGAKIIQNELRRI